MTYFFAITKDLVVVFKNVFQKLSISKTDRSSSEIWDCQWHETFSVNTSLYRLDLVAFFFKLSKYFNVVILLIFDFFLLSPMLFQLVE